MFSYSYTFIYNKQTNIVFFENSNINYSVPPLSYIYAYYCTFLYLNGVNINYSFTVLYSYIYLKKFL